MPPQVQDAVLMTLGCRLLAGCHSFVGLGLSSCGSSGESLLFLSLSLILLLHFLSFLPPPSHAVHPKFSILLLLLKTALGGTLSSAGDTQNLLQL
jgi:ABC-type multidrug transport system permease subunit